MTSGARSIVDLKMCNGRRMIRRTKIICTIGPATASYDKLKAMKKAGMDVARINMSHATQGDALKIIRWVKKLNHNSQFPMAVLLDTQGPEIRTGEISDPLNLATGDIVSLSVRDDRFVEQNSIMVNYDELVDVVKVGGTITVDNGLINFKVLEKDSNKLTCEVLDGGTLGSRKHVNLPGIRVNLPAITAKDLSDIEFGCENEVDYIALSFVRRPEDVLELRRLLARKKSRIGIVSKIEDQEGVTNVNRIAALSDGVMVARGDLGIETDIADLPNVQRRIVHACAEQGVRSIVATHLLESMIDNPIPTRAEVTDVANAIYEGVDAIMLSGETSVGKFPIKCVEQLDKIAQRTERFPGLGYESSLKLEHEKQHVAVHAVALAESLEAKGIVVITRHGLTADFVTSARPHKVPIFAFTNQEKTLRKLALNRAVSPYRIPFSADSEKMLARAFKMLASELHMELNSKLVVVSDVLVNQPTEAIQVRTLA